MFRHEWYQQIYDRFPKIVSDAEAYGQKLNLNKLKGRIGLYSGSSACPARLREISRIGAHQLLKQDFSGDNRRYYD